MPRKQQNSVLDKPNLARLSSQYLYMPFSIKCTHPFYINEKDTFLAISYDYETFLGDNVMITRKISFWLREWDSNPRSLGYEPNEMTKLLYLAIYIR